MKKLVLITLLMVSITTMAQRHKEGHGAQERPNREALKNMTPEQHATLKTKKMTLDLDLNESQERAMMAINLEAAKKRASKRAQRSEKKEMSSEEHYQKRLESLEGLIETKKKIKAILSEEQFAKFERTCLLYTSDAADD